LEEKIIEGQTYWRTKLLEETTFGEAFGNKTLEDANIEHETIGISMKIN
jgi:hypothetical protein